MEAAFPASTSAAAYVRQCSSNRCPATISAWLAQGRYVRHHQKIRPARPCPEHIKRTVSARRFVVVQQLFIYLNSITEDTFS